MGNWNTYILMWCEKDDDHNLCDNVLNHENIKLLYDVE